MGRAVNLVLAIVFPDKAEVMLIEVESLGELKGYVSSQISLAPGTSNEHVRWLLDSGEEEPRDISDLADDDNDGLPLREVGIRNLNVVYVELPAADAIRTIEEVAKYQATDYPLVRASSDGHVAAMKLLIAKGADVNATNRMGYTPLYRAVEMGHLAAIDILIEMRACLDLDNGYSPLDMAATKGNVAVMELLIARGARIDSLNTYRRTPLLRAASHGYVEAVRVLISKGADVSAVDDGGNNALHLAANMGHARVVKVLLDSEFAIDAKDSRGMTPLLKATEYGHLEAIVILLSHGANADACDKEGNTPLHNAAVLLAGLDLLLDHGACIASVNTYGRTAYTNAIYNGNVAAVEFLRGEGHLEEEAD